MASIECGKRMFCHEKRGDRGKENVANLMSFGDAGVFYSLYNPAIQTAIYGTTYVLISIPPGYTTSATGTFIKYDGEDVTEYNPLVFTPTNNNTQLIASLTQSGTYFINSNLFTGYILQITWN